MKFEIHAKHGKARAGTISTPHGDIQTPAFAVVGTKASVKSLTPEQITETGAQVVLANTYHLYLEPGPDIVRDAGGFGRFMNWKGPTITDSGGFQVFSLGAAYGTTLSKIVKPNKELAISSARVDLDDPTRPKTKLVSIDHDGVMFRSHLDGTAHYFTPEKSIEIQHALGADIFFAFDECTSPQESYAYQAEAMDRTHRWAKRCLAYHVQSEHADSQAIFGVVQGGREKKLREESARILADMEIGGRGFDGFGIGGSFDKQDMDTAVRWVNDILPNDKPRHLLGIGEPEDLFMGVENGVDLFDCVAPTRNARNGTVYTHNGKINLMNTQYRTQRESLDVECACYTCKNFSTGYIAHLFHAKEMLAATLATIHNVYFITHLVKNMRASIIDGSFEQYRDSFLKKYLSKVK